MNTWVKGCAGVKVAGATKLYANGEYITEREGDLLFTNYGISGLAILDLSREVSTRLGNLLTTVNSALDLMPEYSKEKLTNLLLGRIQSESEKPVGTLVTRYHQQKTYSHHSGTVKK